MITRFTCPCCGYQTFLHELYGSYDVCAICFWEDDLIQLKNPDYEGGANKVSLKQAQKNFMQFGACEFDMRQNVRPPLDDEIKDPSWKAFGK